MKNFKVANSNERIEDLESYIKDYVRNNPNVKVYVGCDSKDSGGFTTFSTVIVLKNSIYPWYSKGDGNGNFPGNGGHVLYKREQKPRITDIRLRLWEEANIIIPFAEKLDACLSEVRTKVKGHQRLLTIDFDYNSNAIHKSNRVANEVVGWAAGLGFEYRLKPEAWAASSVADSLL